MRRSVAIVAMLALAFGPATLSSLAHASDRHEGNRHRGPRTIRGKARFVSSSVNQVALQDAGGMPQGQAILVVSRMKGGWGPADSEALMQWDLTWTYSPDCFDGGEGLIFPVTQYDFLTTHSDLSSIHGDLREGELCVNFYDYAQTRFWVEVNILGGTGRFAGATGVARSVGRSQALPPGRFSFSEGRTITTLTLP